MACYAKFISLIKLKNFDEALQFAKSQPSLKNDSLYEAAYILHRKDKNKEAIESLKKIPEDERGPGYNRMMAQALYKLGDFAKAVESYSLDMDKIEEEDVVEDFCTNLAACAANQPDLHDQVQNLLNEHSVATYEFLFNQSLIELKAQDFSSAISQLLKSFDEAQAEGCSEADKARFKVLELHMINSFKLAFNQVEYKS